MSSSAPTGFAVLVPVKPASRAKSRLAGLGDAVRRSLVRSFVQDTVTAALATPRVAGVVVVTDDHTLARDLRITGVEVLPDGVADDLNGSLVQGAAEALRRRPGAALAAVCADLPALSSDDLEAALEEAEDHLSSFVADAAGEGTTLYTARTLEAFRPCFGTASRAEHLRQGAHEVVAHALPTLRRDVDTPADLDSALDLGVGTYTRAVLARHSL